MPLLLIPLLFIAFLVWVLTRKKPAAPADALLSHGSLESTSSGGPALAAGSSTRALPGTATRALPKAPARALPPSST